jgi:putative transposase
MSMTDEKNPAVESSAFGALTPPVRNSREVIKELTEQGALDGLFAQIDAGQLQLTGEGGFVPGRIKAALERGLQVELADHVG